MEMTPLAKALPLFDRALFLAPALAIVLNIVQSRAEKSARNFFVLFCFFLRLEKNRKQKVKKKKKKERKKKEYLVQHSNLAPFLIKQNMFFSFFSFIFLSQSRRQVAYILTCLFAFKFLFLMVGF